MTLFSSFDDGGDNVNIQFISLAIYAYTHLIAQMASNENKIKKSRTAQFKTITEKSFAFKNSNFRTYTQDDLPKNLDEIYELYLAQPITEEDKKNYLLTYILPLYKTGLTIQELDKINPDAMERPLHLLMLSKKIQYINLNIRTICTNPAFNTICKNKVFIDDLKEAKKKYQTLYDDIETQIAESWVDAISKEPRFMANPDILKLNTLGYKDLRLKNLNTYKHLLTGGKYYTIHKKHKNKYRRTKKRSYNLTNKKFKI
jgi:hypothetical protein